MTATLSVHLHLVYNEVEPVLPDLRMHHHEHVLPLARLVGHLATDPEAAIGAAFAAQEVRAVVGVEPGPLRHRRGAADVLGGVRKEQHGNFPAALEPGGLAAIRPLHEMIEQLAGFEVGPGAELRDVPCARSDLDQETVAAPGGEELAASAEDHGPRARRAVCSAEGWRRAGV